MTPLTWAAGRGHTEIVGLLVDKGAKVNTADKVGDKTVREFVSCFIAIFFGSHQYANNRHQYLIR